MELTTTSYALLGLLALRPWSTYELAHQVQRSLRGLWPVAERQLYEQPKALVAHGLATASREKTGARPRTVYRITPAGRRELRRWLRAPDGDLTVRSELALKVFFAEHAGIEALHASIDGLRQRVGEQLDEHIALFEATREHGYPFPERRHLSALVAQLYFDIGEAVARWADWADAEVDTWPEDLSPPAHADRLMTEVYRRQPAPRRPPRRRPAPSEHPR
jgi:DNA-binding PadR family transcriptional regulator